MLYSSVFSKLYRLTCSQTQQCYLQSMILQKKRNFFRKRNASVYSLQRSTTNSAASSNSSTNGSTSSVPSLSPKELPLQLLTNSDHHALSERNVCNSKTAAPSSDILGVGNIEQKFSSYPTLRSRSRKRKRNEKRWKRIIQKPARNSGKEYVNSRNKKVKER